MHKRLIIGLAAASVLVAEPALAQYSSQDQSRVGRVSGEIARTVEEAARAMGTITDAFDRSWRWADLRGGRRKVVWLDGPADARYPRES